MIYQNVGGVSSNLGRSELKAALFAALDKLGPRKRVLLLPPDFTRFHSQAGFLSQCVYEYYGEA